jgi:hypothetical protein
MRALFDPARHPPERFSTPRLSTECPAERALIELVAAGEAELSRSATTRSGDPLPDPQSALAMP